MTAATEFVLGLLVLLQSLLIGLLLVRRRARHAELTLLRQQQEVVFSFIHDVGDVFAEADELDLDLMLKRILFYGLRTTHAGAGALYLYDREHQVLRAHAQAGIFPPLASGGDLRLDKVASRSQQIEQMVANQPIRPAEGLIGGVFDLGAALLIEDAERDPRVPHYEVDYLQIRSLLLLPMRFHQRVLGVLALVNRTDQRPFTQGDQSLAQALADQASVSLHFAGLRDDLRRKERIDSDLEVARRIQTSLLPKELPRLAGYELAAFSEPALEVGGDYFDVIPVDDEHVGLMIADVSGKGISGAIMMSICRSVGRAVARGRHSPREMLIDLAQLTRDDVAEEMFVTLLYMVLELPTRRLRVARAGHEPLILARQDAAPELIEAPGLALGIGDLDLFTGELGEVEVQLAPGDLVLVYTDGITEAQDEHGREWGGEPLLRAIAVAQREGAHSAVSHVREHLRRFTGSAPQYDDMTMLALRVGQNHGA
ncbi:MAG: SpoIIE family protein phosphatase [Candidatus Marinimicrobia bacterium]|nr:SpoIIE family protein phosphatase [Candidatus Neomarinimicrobiota bacterium]